MVDFVDSRNRSLEIGQRVRIEEDVDDGDGGMLSKHSIVYLESFNHKTGKINVKDRLGKMWDVDVSKTSSSFL